MKSKQLVLVAIALICGIVSAIGIFQAIANKAPVAEKIPMGPVLVASDHIDMKAELTETNVRLENWPQHLIPEGAAADLEDVKGKFILTRLRSGQAVILEDVKPESELMIKNIPPGHKVINIKVPAEDLIGGLLEPGDRVDIIGIFNIRKNGETESETKTFLKGIRVFNIGTSTSGGEANRTASAAGIVGVLVTGKQSERIVWARKNGEIRLALVGDSVEESQDIDFPTREDTEQKAEPMIAGPSFFNRQPKVDMSKLRKVKIYTGGEMKVTYFDKEGKQVSLEPAADPGMGMGGMGMPVGFPGGMPAGFPSGGMPPMPPMPGGASGLPPVDYEGFNGSANIPNGIEEDQYRGE